MYIVLAPLLAVEERSEALPRQLGLAPAGRARGIRMCFSTYTCV